MATAPDPALMLSATLDADRGRILAALIARLGDFALAEDALQEAASSALEHWGRSGVPERPLAWLIRVAFRKAIDALRRQARDTAKVASLAVLARDEAAEDPEMIADERLRLIFTCCHPALEPKTRVALTLRTIAGLSTAEIARAFLDQEATMAQRLSRARAKIAAAGIPFQVPEAEDLPERINSVLTVVYLIFNAGYTAGPALERDLCAEAIFLARLLEKLMPGEAEVEGVLALMLVTHARRAARQVAGESVALADQDRALWDQPMLALGLATLDGALARTRPGPFQIKAAIAACQSQTPPDWPQIAALYAGLYLHEPTPIVRLNQAVAVAEAGDLPAALAALSDLAEPLAAYQPYHAACAEYLARAGQTAAALAAYDRAIAGAASDADAAFLTRRRGALGLSGS